MASDPMEPDRLREMLAGPLASDDVARLRGCATRARAVGADDLGAAMARAADALEAVPRLRERVAVLEAALRDARESVAASYFEHGWIAAEERLARIDALLSGSTTLAEHDAAVRRAALEEAAEACELHRERIKHTRHTDGIGMGFQAGEAIAAECAHRIRALAEGK